MGKIIGTKLIDSYHRSPHTKQEKTKVLDTKEQGVKPRRTKLPSNWDDIHIDKGKTVPYNYKDRISHRSWKARAKARKQWERKGNIVFVGILDNSWRITHYEKVDLGKRKESVEKENT